MTATWASLGAIISDLRARADRLHLPPDPGHAGALSAERPGYPKPGVPELVDVAALALACASRPVLHRVRPAAVRMVHETDLHSIPAEPPRLLRGPWLVEVDSPEQGEALWDDTVGCGGYDLDGATRVVGLRHPDGVKVASWNPRWTGEELAAGSPPADPHPLVADVGEPAAWAREAARFVIVLGLLLDAEDSPIHVDVERRGWSGQPGGWSVRHVGRQDPVLMGDEAPWRAFHVPGPRPLEPVAVRGHLLRERHGVDGARSRWHYVAGSAPRRWVTPRELRPKHG